MAGRLTLWCPPIRQEMTTTQIWRMVVVVATAMTTIYSQPRVPGLDALNEILNWYALFSNPPRQMLACIQADLPRSPGKDLTTPKIQRIGQ